MIIHAKKKLYPKSFLEHKSFHWLVLCLGEGDPDDPVVGRVGHVEEALFRVQGQVVLVLAAAHVQAQQLLATAQPVKLPDPPGQLRQHS